MPVKYREYTVTWATSETEVRRKKRARTILQRLQKQYDREKTMLEYGNPMQLLVAVMLSAQCTDKKVNEVTHYLFRKYITARDYADAKPEIFEQEIRQTGFYRAKTRHIINTAKIIVETFKGEVPTSMNDLLTLPGVARKTANVVLINAFGIVEGIPIDTHVSRIAQRLALTRDSGPPKIEQDLMRLYPRKDWEYLSYYIIHLGREICTARNRKCNVCPLRNICPSSLTKLKEKDK